MTLHSTESSQVVEKSWRTLRIRKSSTKKNLNPYSLSWIRWNGKKTISPYCPFKENVHPNPVYNPHRIFSKYCPFKFPSHCWKWKFLTVYSLFCPRVWKIGRKYLSVYEECTESIEAYSENSGKYEEYMENTAHLGFFALHKIVSECAESIYKYSENTQ